MICYKDTTFCADDEKCAEKFCSRRLTADDEAQASKSGLPVAWSHFSHTCKFYKPINNPPMHPDLVRGEK